MSETAELPEQNNDTVNGKDAAPPVFPSEKLIVRVVYIMGIILALLFVTLIGAIIWKSTRKAEPLPNPVPAQIDLGLVPGAVIRSAVANGDRLVIATDAQVIVIDLKRNAVTARMSSRP